MYLQEGRDWRLPGLLYTDDLVVCGESEEDLPVVMKIFEVFQRRDLKVNEDKSMRWCWVKTNDWDMKPCG